MTVTQETKTTYLTVQDVADRYRVSTDTIYRWKREGDLPPAFKVGPGTTRWRLSDLIEHDSKLQTCFATMLTF